MVRFEQSIVNKEDFSAELAKDSAKVMIAYTIIME